MMNRIRSRDRSGTGRAQLQQTPTKPSSSSSTVSTSSRPYNPHSPGSSNSRNPSNSSEYLLISHNRSPSYPQPEPQPLNTSHPISTPLSSPGLDNEEESTNHGLGLVPSPLHIAPLKAAYYGTQIDGLPAPRPNTLKKDGASKSPKPLKARPKTAPTPTSQAAYTASHLAPPPSALYRQPLSPPQSPTLSTSTVGPGSGSSSGNIRRRFSSTLDTLSVQLSSSKSSKAKDDDGGTSPITYETQLAIKAEQDRDRENKSNESRGIGKMLRTRRANMDMGEEGVGAGKTRRGLWGNNHPAEKRVVTPEKERETVDLLANLIGMDHHTPSKHKHQKHSGDRHSGDRPLASVPSSVGDDRDLPSRMGYYEDYARPATVMEERADRYGRHQCQPDPDAIEIMPAGRDRYPGRSNDQHILDPVTSFSPGEEHLKSDMGMASVSGLENSARREQNPIYAMNGNPMIMQHANDSGMVGFDARQDPNLKTPELGYPAQFPPRSLGPPVQANPNYSTTTLNSPPEVTPTPRSAPVVQRSFYPSPAAPEPTHPPTQVPAQQPLSKGSRIAKIFGGGNREKKAVPPKKRPNTSDGNSAGSRNVSSPLGMRAGSKNEPLPRSAAQNEVVGLGIVGDGPGGMHMADNISVRVDHNQTSGLFADEGKRQQGTNSAGMSEVSSAGSQAAMESYARSQHSASGLGMHSLEPARTRTRTASTTTGSEMGSPDSRHTMGGMKHPQGKPMGFDTIAFSPSSMHMPVSPQFTEGGESHVSDILRWGQPPNDENAYPTSKKERNACFKWEPNIGVTDGKLVMGFGGEYGKRRVKKRKGGDRGAPGRSQVYEEARGMGMGGSGTDLSMPYIIGYERSVLDCEALVHQAYTELCDGKLTFYPDDLPPPRRVLDIGTGIGMWPIAMAQHWPQTEFIGLDIAPIQTDLEALARAQKMLAMMKEMREEAIGGEGSEEGELRERGLDEEVGGGGEGGGSGFGKKVDWEDIARRVKWRIGNFLDDLPFDGGSFDMVHLRFLGLGIPETAWEPVIENCSRVLKRDTGILEIVEMSKSLPSQTPVALRASFSSLLLSSFLNPNPFTIVRPTLVNTKLSHWEAFSHTYHRNELGSKHPLATIENCLAAWVDSSLSKGRHGRGRGMNGSVGALVPRGGQRLGQEVLGDRAWEELEEYLESQKEGEEGDMNGKGGRKSEEEKKRLVEKGVGEMATSREEKEKDDMTVVAWIVRKRLAH